MNIKINEKAEKGKWELHDLDNGIICTFEEHRWNDTQKWDLSHYDKSNCTAEHLSKLMRQYGDYLVKYYPNLIF